MANLLANSFLFTHQADAEQNQHSFVSHVSPDEWKTDIPSPLDLVLVSSQCNTISLLFSCQMIYFCSQAKFDTRSAYTCFFESFLRSGNGALKPIGVNRNSQGTSQKTKRVNWHCGISTLTKGNDINNLFISSNKAPTLVYSRPTVLH